MAGSQTTGAEQILGAPPQRFPQDEGFQSLLLEFSTAAAKAVSPAEILRLFCRTTRAYFGVSGAYIWHFFPPDQLVAEEADGWMADQFRNVRLKTNQSAIVVETIQKRKPILVNSVDTRPLSLGPRIRDSLPVGGTAVDVRWGNWGDSFCAHLRPRIF